MKYWIMKSEPDVFGIGDLEKQNKPEPWDGVRNYQARNFMKNEMKIGDWDNSGTENSNIMLPRKGIDNFLINYS